MEVFSNVVLALPMVRVPDYLLVGIQYLIPLVLNI